VFGVREDSDLCLQKWPVRGVASSPPFDLFLNYLCKVTANYDRSTCLLIPAYI